MFTHPNWNPYTINNDIALIKLASPARLGTNVSPVCLAASADAFAAGTTCVTSGWGLTRYNGESTSIGSTLWLRVTVILPQRAGGSVVKRVLCTVSHSSQYSQQAAAGCSAPAVQRAVQETLG